MAGSYVEATREVLVKSLPGEPDDLIRLYTLLAVLENQPTLEDVHDAWATWKEATDPDHKSLTPFDNLTEDVQELDRPYLDAIMAARAGQSLDPDELAGRG